MKTIKLKTLLQELNFQTVVDRFVSNIFSHYPQIDKFAMYYDQDGGFLYLTDLYIKKEHQKSGFGSKIMNDVILFADTHKLPIVLMPISDDDDDDSKLIAFYSKFGFKRNTGVISGDDLEGSMYRLPKK